jgi:hypothetical protein
MTTAAKPVASPSVPPTLEEAEAKLAEIEKKLSRLDTLVQERADWQAYRYSLLKVTKQEAGPATAPIREAAPVFSGSLKQPIVLEDGVPLPLTTVDHAEKALKAKGSAMRLGEMLEVVRRNGWKGSGDDRLDRDRLYSAMHRQRHRFTPAGRQTWKLKMQ